MAVNQLAAIAVVVVLSGCGGSSGVTRAPATTPAAPAPSSAAAAPAPSSAVPAKTTGTVITTAGSDYGVMLFDQKGQAIYLFDKEKTSAAKCYDRCAAAWPPVLTKGAAQAAGAARKDLLSTTKRADGREQVTYAGHPLYYYAFEKPHQVLCHDVVEYGGRWLVVTPSGAAAA
jgi:predicted lipoprotein with Yx(FWY)xxD motif